MNKLVTGAIGVVAVLALFLAVQSPAPQVIERPVGAVASPDIPSPWIRFGGVQTYAQATNSLTQGSATVCSLQSPNATSTLVSGGIRFTTASSTQWLVEIGKATTNSATTTLLGTGIITANGQGTILASSTFGLGVDPVQVFAPSTYFNVKVPTAGGGAPVGHCHAVWEVYQ